MDAKGLLQSQLEAGRWTLLEAQKLLADGEFYVRLPNAGESADWLFGHLAVNEDWFLSELTGSALQVPQELRDVYFQDFPATTVKQGVLGRKELLALFDSQRTRVITALKDEDTSKWDTQAPKEFPTLFKTVGAIWGLLGTHQYWHIGQLMTIRTMLHLPAFDFNSPQSGAGTSEIVPSDNLIVPSDGPRVLPRRPDQVSVYVRAAFDKARETWGINNNLAYTMGCQPFLAQTEVDYANSFIFQQNTYAEMPNPDSENSGRAVLFPACGFIDRIMKELIISLVSLLNRSRYSITHHTFIGYNTLSGLVAGKDSASRQLRAEAMLLHLVDKSGRPTFYDSVLLDGEPLYSDFQVCAMDIAYRCNADPHQVSDTEMLKLRDLMKIEAATKISSGPLQIQFGSAGPSDAYVESYVDGMMVELTWLIAHYSGLLNRWFTLLKVRDEDFVVDESSGQNFIQVYNSVLPTSLKVRNNFLFGHTGWGY